MNFDFTNKKDVETFTELMVVAYQVMIERLIRRFYDEGEKNPQVDTFSCLGEELTNEIGIFSIDIVEVDGKEVHLNFMHSYGNINVEKGTYEAVILLYVPIYHIVETDLNGHLLSIDSLAHVFTTATVRHILDLKNIKEP